jgi:hypothetical protein
MIVSSTSAAAFCSVISFSNRRSGDRETVSLHSTWSVFFSVIFRLFCADVAKTLTVTFKPSVSKPINRSFDAFFTAPTSRYGKKY